MAECLQRSEYEISCSVCGGELELTEFHTEESNGHYTLRMQVKPCETCTSWMEKENE